MTTILIAGFGPFPGAPFNPTGPLAGRLARLRRPALADTRRIAHVFQTSYAAVDRELPALIARHRPDIVLMFGLAARTPFLRIETRAKNTISLLPGADRASPQARSIAKYKPAALALRNPRQSLLAAARAARVPARLSRDAGNYLCNYLCWRAAEAADGRHPRLVAFIHVPNVRRKALRRMPRKLRKPLTLDDLTRAGSAILTALAGAARRRLPNVNRPKE